MAVSSSLGRALALLSALAVGAMAGCPFELPRGLSCGDGWWDAEFEQCDPQDPDSPHIEACRDQGFAGDGVCDPRTCTIRASEVDCNVCGDGIAAADEQCDGDDLRGESCVSGTLRCNDDCSLDYSSCPAFCGDEIVNGSEECEFAVVCSEVDDCNAGMTCYQGNCVPAGENFLPNLSCDAFATKAIGINKPYASGTIAACVKDGCYFGRNDCSFCGDGELDGAYEDVIAPEGTSEFPPEVCDGELANQGALADYCAPLCAGEDPFNSDVVVLCDFECRADCSGFQSKGDVLPGQDPSDFGCCMAKDAPCPKFGIEGVPDYPCCSWLDNPKWMDEQKCVLSDSQTPPMTFVCP